MSMKYEVTEGNVKKIYSVHFDKKKLTNVLNHVCRETRYIVKDDRHDMPSGAKYEGNKIISGAELPNGDPMFINIKSIYTYTSGGPLSYHNDSVGIDGAKVIVPELAYILADLLTNENADLQAFLDYEKSDELISIDEKIAMLSYELEKGSNMDYDKKIHLIDYDKKIQLLEMMKTMSEKKEKNQFINAYLLRMYYKKACSIIELHLEEEIITEKKCDEKVKLKDFLKGQNNR